MVAGTLALPPSKLSEVTERLQAALEAPTWSRLTVERILGSLVHASRVLPHARFWVGSSLSFILGRRALAPRRFPPRSQQGRTSACGLTCFVRGLARLCCA